MSEEICPSCGKTDKRLWPEGCNNEWHRDGMQIAPVVGMIERVPPEPEQDHSTDPTHLETIERLQEWVGTKVQTRKDVIPGGQVLAILYAWKRIILEKRAKEPPCQS